MEAVMIANIYRGTDEAGSLRASIQLNIMAVNYERSLNVLACLMHAAKRARTYTTSAR